VQPVRATCVHQYRVHPPGSLKTLTAKLAQICNMPYSICFAYSICLAGVALSGAGSEVGLQQGESSTKAASVHYKHNLVHDSWNGPHAAAVNVQHGRSGNKLYLHASMLNASGWRECIILNPKAIHTGVTLPACRLGGGMWASWPP
jgi:hypothetical protein